MDRLKRLFYLTFFNVLVSATTTLAVLSWWDANMTRQAGFEQAAALTSQQPAVTIIVIGAASEGTALVETLGLPTATLGTPTPQTPTPGSFLYQVQPGDTLSIIADQFDVSLFDILAVNNLADPNNLSVGQEITVPTGPLPTRTPTSTPSPLPSLGHTPTPLLTRLASATPTPDLGAPEVLIESILGAGDLATEQVRINLRSGADISLAGWRLADSNGNVYIFPQLDLFTGGGVTVNTRAGSNTASDLYWGLDAPVWQAGEEAQLIDAQGELKATYRVP